MAKNSDELNLRTPPQSLEAEEAVLGAMLTSKDAVSRALEILLPESFYKEAHRRIFEVMQDLFNLGEPVDAVSVTNELKKRKQLDASGGAYFITGLSDSVPTTANIEHYARIVLEKSSLRGLIDLASDLDDITSGFQEGELIIVAGRPSMGKTALALTFARNAAVEHKIPVGIFSLEMSNSQLAMRLLTSEARVDSHLVRTGKLPKEQWKNLSLSVGTLAEAPIFLDDTPAMGITELRAKSRRLKAEKDVQLIMVDYLQMMHGTAGSESRQQEISQISRSLKALAKEISVPVVALSQLSRAPEARSDHRPQLSDLRESGAIEQDADVVMFLYRKYVYSRDEEDRRRAEIIVSKQRNGPTGTVPLIFVDSYAKFESATIFDQMIEEPA